MTDDSATLAVGASSYIYGDYQPTYEMRDRKNNFYAAKWQLPPHRRRSGCQAHHLLIYWLGNTRIFRTADGQTRRRDAHPGTVTFIPGGECADYRFLDHNVFFEAHFSPALVHEFSERTLTRFPSIQPFRIDDDAWLTGYFQMLQAEMDLHGSAKHSIDSLLLGQAQQLLLAHLAQRYFNATARPNDEAVQSRRGYALRAFLLKRVTDYIHEHLGADMRIADLAALADLSEAHFIRAFSAATGRSPYQYVIDKRLEASAELLRAGEALSIAEVANRMGFKSQSHFTARFRMRYGLTPRDYRRN